MMRFSGNVSWIISFLFFAACGGGGSGGGGANPISIGVVPSAATLHTGEGQIFTATITGSPNKGVQWKVVEADGGSIDAGGNYQAPVSVGVYHVIGTSVADSTQTASATITVNPLAGAPDSGFGIGGKVTTAIGSGGDTASGVVIQPDGKRVIVGTSFNGTNNDIIVARYTADGALDTTFGTRGVTLIDFSQDDDGYAIVLDRLGRIVVAGDAFNFTNKNFDFAVARLDSDGVLDGAFGFGGRVTTPMGTWGSASSLAIQGDDKIVVAGSAYNGANDDFGVARYNPSGLLDTGFGVNGKVITSIGAGNDIPFAVAVTSTAIVVAGDTDNGSDFDFALIRYDLAGNLDSAFGTGGKVVTAVGASHDAIRAMEIRNNRIFVAGFSYTPAGSDIVLVCYDATGALDSTFGNNGTVLTQIASGMNLPFSLKIQNDEMLLIGGEVIDGAHSDFFVARYSKDGVLDPTFGAAGVAVTDFGSGEDAAYAVAIAADGKVFLAGESSLEGNRDIALAQYSPNGAPDLTFGSEGKQKLDLGMVGSGEVESLAIQSDGKIIAAGDVSDGSVSIWELVRYQADGNIDSTFGKNGKASTFLNTGRGGEIAIQPDGKIVAVGAFSDGDNASFAVTRLLPDGSVDPSFGENGERTIAFMNSKKFSSAFAYAVAVQTDGKILVGGPAFITSPTGDNFDFALVRLLPDGTLDSAFGQVVTPVGSGDDAPVKIVLQPDGKIVMAGYAANGTKHNFALVRYNSDGSLDTSFGPGGKVMSGVGSADDGEAYAVRIQKDGKLVLGGYTLANGNYDFALERYDADGILDGSFGLGGEVTTPFGAGNDGVGDLLLQEDGKIVATGFSTGNFAVARYHSDGSLDLTFGAAGKVTYPIGPGVNYANTSVARPDGKIVVGGGLIQGGHAGFALAQLWP